MTERFKALEGWQVITTDECGNIITEGKRRSRRGGSEIVSLQRIADGISFTRGDSIVVKDVETQSYSVYLVNEIRLNTLNSPVEILAFTYLRWFELKPVTYYEQLQPEVIEDDKNIDYYKDKFLNEINKDELYLTAELSELTLKDFISLADVVSDQIWESKIDKISSISFFVRYICEPSAEHFIDIDFETERKKISRLEPKAAEEYLKRVPIPKVTKIKSGKSGLDSSQNLILDVRQQRNRIKGFLKSNKKDHDESKDEDRVRNLKRVMSHLKNETDSGKENLPSDPISSHGLKTTATLHTKDVGSITSVNLDLDTTDENIMPVSNEEPESNIELGSNMEKRKLLNKASDMKQSKLFFSSTPKPTQITSEMKSRYGEGSQTSNILPAINDHNSDKSTNYDNNIHEKYSEYSNKLNLLKEKNNQLFHSFTSNKTDINIAGIENSLKRDLYKSQPVGTSQIYDNKFSLNRLVFSSRTKEFSKILSEADFSLKNNVNTVVYVTGGSCTGKTFTVNCVIHELEKPKEISDIPAFKYIHHDCFVDSSNSTCYQSLWKEISGELKGNDVSKSALKYYFKEVPKDRKRSIVLTVDNINIKNNVTKEFFKSILKWNTYGNAKFIIIAISPTDDISKLDLPSEITDKLILKPIYFLSYSKEELTDVVKFRFLALSRSWFSISKATEKLVEHQMNDVITDANTGILKVVLDYSKYDECCRLIANNCVDIKSSLSIIDTSVDVAFKESSIPSGTLVINLKNIKNAINIVLLNEEYSLIDNLPSIFKMVLKSIINLESSKNSNENQNEDDIIKEVFNILKNENNINEISNIRNVLLSNSNHDNKDIDQNSLAILSFDNILKILSKKRLIKGQINSITHKMENITLINVDQVKRALESWA